MRELSFWVGVCLGRGDSGNVLVDIEVSDTEYDTLIECCRSDEDVDEYEPLRELRKRIVSAAINEASSCDEGSDIDYNTDVWYVVQMPEEIWNIVHG